jgi:hypothetical protein
LTSITLGKVTQIGYRFMYNCNSLTNINLGNVTQIGDNFMVECTNLRTITIPRKFERLVSNLEVKKTFT